MGLTFRWVVQIGMLLSVQATNGQDRRNPHRQREIQKLASPGTPLGTTRSEREISSISRSLTSRFSRDVRISVSGEIGFPLIHEESGRRAYPFPIRG